MSEIEKISKLDSESKLYTWRETINNIIDKLTNVCEEYLSLSEKKNDYHNLGEIWITFDNSVEFDGREFNGDILSRKLYHNLFEYISTKPNLYVTEETYHDLLKTNGYCNYYTLGSDNETFRLPYLKNDNYKIGVRVFGKEKENMPIVGKIIFSINDYVPENAIALNGQQVNINDYSKLYAYAQDIGNLIDKTDSRYTSIGDSKNNPFYVDNNDGTFNLPNIKVNNYFKNCTPYVYYDGITDDSKNNIGDLYFIFNENENIPSYVSKLNGQELNSEDFPDLITYIDEQFKTIDTSERNSTLEPKYSIDSANSKIILPNITIQDDIIVGVITKGKNPTEEHVNWMDLIHTADSEYNKNRYVSDPDYGMRTKVVHDDTKNVDNYDVHIQRYERPEDYRFLRADKIWSDDYVPKSRNSTISADLIIDGTLNVTGNIIGANVYNAIWNEEEPYGDIAEYFQKGCKTERGDIIALDEEAEEESYIKAKIGMKYYGVHSESYRYIMGGDMSSSNPKELNRRKYIPVALIGRVPVKVMGKVKKGDYIQLSYVEGVGIVTQEWNENVFGVACESSNDNAVKLVLVRLYK